MEIKNIKRLFFATLRKWWIIFLLVVFCGGIAGYNSLLNTTPMYRTDTTLYFMNLDRVEALGQKLNSEDLKISKQLIQDYIEIIHSRKVITAVLKSMRNPTITESDVKSMVSIDTKNDSNVVNLTVIWKDPQVAALVANTMAVEFAIQMKQLTNSDYVGVLDQALVPKVPIPVNHTRSILLGALFGLIVSLAIIYTIEYLDTTIRAAEEVELGAKLRVIGIIPEHAIH